MEESINKILREVLYRDWMSEEEYQSIKEATLKKADITITDLVKELNQGVGNGYSVSEQLEIVRVIFKQFDTK